MMVRLAAQSVAHEWAGEDDLKILLAKGFVIPFEIGHSSSSRTEARTTTFAMTATHRRFTKKRESAFLVSKRRHWYTNWYPADNRSDAGRRSLSSL